MSMWLIIIIVLAAAAVAVLAFTRPAIAGGTGKAGLRRRFGPEYERTVTRHGGDSKAAEQELAARVKRYGGLKERPLSADAAEGYEAEWARAQERFVDAPGEAVAGADRLITRVAHDRGYPDGTHEELIEALSVKHPRHVAGYRNLHEIAGRTPDGAARTEELREVLVHARELFADLTGGRVPAAEHHHRGTERGAARRLTERMPSPRAIRRGGGARGSAS